jgi:DNA-binding CsgD family transcriptional regulator
MPPLRKFAPAAKVPQSPSGVDVMTGHTDTPPPKRSAGAAKIRPFDKKILDSLSAHIALLDAEGVILETNRAWRDYGKANDIAMHPATLNINYLDICDMADGNGAAGSSKAARGIRDVIAGKLEEFTMDYPCHSPTQKMWFYMRVTGIVGTDPYRAAVCHENITPLKLAEETIQRREQELELKSQSLEEANTALKVLLKQREADKKELEEKVVTNIRQLVTPYLEKISQTRLDPRQRAFLDIIEGHLNDVISPFLQRMSTLHLHLTPQEIQVASLVKSGKSTKEIADILGISTNAVDFHRKNIRQKFGLKHQKTNLRSFLMSLT